VNKTLKNIKVSLEPIENLQKYKTNVRVDGKIVKIMRLWFGKL